MGAVAFNTALQQAVALAEARLAAANPQSAARHERARRVLPGGHTRQTVFYRPFPLTMVEGAGAWLTDIDGHRYLDLVGDYAAGLYGHTCAPILEAARTALEHGLSLGAVSGAELELAELISGRVASMEQIRFCNSGSEACLFAALLARHATGRAGLLVFKGSYHGGFMVYGERDSPLNVPFDVVKCRYNDVAGTRATLREHASRLAAVVVEPMMGAAGCIPAEPGFLAMLQEECARLGVILIFDEVMTSRLGAGALQEHYGIRPDITTIGKFWGGGLNFGAFGGARELMGHFDAGHGGMLSQGGTFNNNVVTMATGLAGAKSVYTPEACATLNRRGDTLRERLNAIADERGVALQVTGLGAVMNLHWHRRPIHDAGDAEPADSPQRRLFQLEMILRGYYIAQRGLITLSVAHTDAQLSAFVDAVGNYLDGYSELTQRLSGELSASESG